MAKRLQTVTTAGGGGKVAIERSWFAAPGRIPYFGTFPALEPGALAGVDGGPEWLAPVVGPCCAIDYRQREPGN
jgi:hypothetical protein